MTFGRTLGELTGLCGVKRSNLADALGYDPSYISRWINGVKLPSTRNNEELFQQIADYLTANANPDTRSRIAVRFDLMCEDLSDAGFARALAGRLSAAHAADRGSRGEQVHKYGNENAMLHPVNDIVLFPESIFSTVQQIPGGRQMDMICTMPIHAQFKNNDSFFRRILDILPGGSVLRVMQFVDLEDVASRTDSACRSFCYLVGLGERIRYEFYEFRPSKAGYVYVIRDGLLLQYLREPFSGELHILECSDKDIISRYCTSADAFVRDRLPMASREDMQQLMKRQYFLDYFMQPRCRCLLRYMQPFFLPEEMKERLLAGQPEMQLQLKLFLNGAEYFESILLYQLALVDYINTGRLMLPGAVITVPPEDRLLHLKNMLAQLEKTPERLSIISTRNKVCGYNDIPVSVFTNRHAAFILGGGEQPEQSACTISSAGMIRQLNIWFDHIEKLPPEECLTGQDAMDYISRCISLL